MNMINVMIDPAWLPPVFIGLMGLSVLVYAILDGYDLGVGILLHPQQESHRDIMIASIGPFWDANETWLVLAIGLMLIAFPDAYNLVLRELYLAATFMLMGLILRGVAFDFRAKVALERKGLWDNIFRLGSLLVALCQGYMLGQYVSGFDDSWQSLAFSLLSAFGVASAYAYIGACWLVMKTENDLQVYAARLGRKAGWMMAVGVLAVCAVNPVVNDSVYQRWFSSIYGLLMLFIPAVSACLFVLVDQVLKRIALHGDHGSAIPFFAVIFIFLICFMGIAYSFYPYIIPSVLTIDEAIAAPEALSFIFWGAIIVVPIILIYTAYSYRVFWGKATDLKYY